VIAAGTRPAPEEGLLERAARGDSGAFDALIRPRLDRLFRLAVAITRSEPDARDAVQDACVSAWRELPRLRDTARFDAWLAQIVVNACRANLRRNRRASVREVPVGDELADHQEPAFATRGHGDEIAEVDAIQRAFLRLEPDTRALLALHYQEELPLAEIGRVFGAPVGTIKWRLSRARAALERALEAERR
jgi:RNA polymerase sigma-70 factor (ECF subfamily)